MPITFIVEGLEGAPLAAEDTDDELAMPAFLRTDEGRELARMFPRFRPERLRRMVLELVRGIDAVEEEAQT